jgi:hypothetical protein
VRADTVVFVLSPDSVASEVALREVAFAGSLNKRFAPIVCRHVDDKTVPQAQARLNFVFFDDDARFGESANRLAEALATDLTWIRLHTDFGEQARRWTLATTRADCCCAPQCSNRRSAGLPRGPAEPRRRPMRRAPM